MIVRAALLACVFLLPGAVLHASQQGRSTGWGWCAACGKDRGPSHDFTHGGYRAESDPVLQAAEPAFRSFFEGIGKSWASSPSRPSAEAERDAARRAEEL